MSSVSKKIEEIGATYLLTLRSERPIEGCELTPYAFLALKGGNTDNSTRAKLLEKTPSYFSYTWSKGPKKSLCCNTSCSRNATYDPLHWSKATLQGPELVCRVCEQSELPVYDMSFCSVNCFRSGWKDHAQCHTVKKSILNTNSHGSGLALLEDSADPRNSATVGNKYDDIEWTKLSTDKNYTPNSNDVGSRIRVEVRALSVADNTELTGPTTVYTEPVLSLPSAPPKRRVTAIPGAVLGLSGAMRFRIVGYNILADLYATKQAYPYCDSWSLIWSYRKKLIQQELDEMQGDVVCLQEVQADHYQQDINPFMTRLGYDGLYRPKSRDYLCGFGKVDGCATFWKRSKFIMTENYSIEFNEIARTEARSLGLEDQEARKFMNRLSKDNIAQIIVLEAINSPPSRGSCSRSSLCVVNTHLYSNMIRGDVKLWQTRHLIMEVQRFVSQRDLPLLICGDFNSEPSSAVHELLSSGSIEKIYPELVDDGGVQVLPNELRSISHNIELASAMNTTFGVEPSFTNFTAKFKGCLDYIWYTPNRLRVIAGADMPDLADLVKVSGHGAGLPCTCYPSDHISLFFDMALC